MQADRSVEGCTAGASEGLQCHERSPKAYCGEWAYRSVFENGFMSGEGLDCEPEALDAVAAAELDDWDEEVADATERLIAAMALVRAADVCDTTLAKL